MGAEVMGAGAPDPEGTADPEATAARSRLAWFGSAALPVALVVAFSAPLWLRRALPVWDGLDFYLPAFAHLGEALREGRLPLWDPYSNGGEPFFADPQRGVLNPALLAIAGLVPDPILGFALGWLAHWCWGALGLWWLARRHGAGPGGAALAGCAYGLSGFWISHAEHLPYLYVAAWLPWVLGLADEAVGRRLASRALLAAGALGLCAVGGGYPMLVAFTGVAAALWLALRHLAFGPPGPERRAALRWTAGTLALMAVVLVAAWSPLLAAFLREATAVSGRLEAIGTEQAVHGSPFGLRAAASLFAPAALNALAARGVDLGADVSMVNGYLGFAVVPLAATWAVAGRRRTATGWLVAFALVMALTSLGGVGGVRWIWHWLVPPLRHMRFNAPFRLFWILAACLAAGGGWSLVARDPAARRTFLASAVAWLLLTAAALVAVATWAARHGLPVTSAAVWLPSAVAGPAVVVLAALLAHRPGRAAAAALLLAACADVAGAAFACRDTVWSPAGQSVTFLDRVLASPLPAGGPPPARVPELGTGSFNLHLLARRPVVRSYTSYRDEGLNGVLHESRFVEVLAGPQRFWLSPSTEVVPAPDLALRILAAAGAGDPLPAFVEAGAPARPGPRLVPGGFGGVRVEAYLPEEIRLEVDVPGDAPALLVSTERFTPAWEVEVDGKPARAVRTNLYFRGVEVAPGVHRVAWRYRPAFWWPLVGLSAATLLACAAGAAWLARRERRRGAAAS